MPITSSPEVRVNTATSGNQVDPLVVPLGGGGYVTFWNNGDGAVLAQMFSSSGAPINGNALVGAGLSPGSFSATATPDGGFLVAYRASAAGDADIALARYDSAGAKVGAAVWATQSPGDDAMPAVTSLADGGFALAWRAAPSGGPVTLKYQLFDGGMAARGPAVTVATAHPDLSGVRTFYPAEPVIAQLTNGDVVVAWSSTAAGYHGVVSGDVHVQRYSAAGAPLGSGTPSSTTTAHHTVGEPAITATSDGGYVVAWVQRPGYMNDSTGQVVVRKFAADGTGGQPVSQEIGGHTSGSVDLAATHDGGFVMTWSGTSASDVYLQAFDAQAQASGEAVRVNENATGLQSDAEVAVLGAGAYAVAWRSDGQDGDQGGIYLRTFGSAAGGDSYPQITAPSGAVGTLYESNLPNGTAPNAAALSVSGVFTIAARDGLGDLVVAGRTIIDDGVFTATTVQTPFAERLEFTGFDAATGQVSYRYTLVGAHKHGEYGLVHGKTETDTVGLAVTDRDGDTTHTVLKFNVVDDRPAPANDVDTVAAGSTTPATGNVLTDASPGDAGDGDSGVDRMGADGGQLIYARTAAGTGGGYLDANGQVVVQGTYGVLTLQRSGDYSYAVNADAPAGSVDRFEYSVREGDSSTAAWERGKLDVTVTAGSGSGGGSGQVYNSPGPGSTVTAGSGDDTINASQGSDLLTGGAGADRFAWAKEPWSPATVTDFVVGTDRIDLAALFQASGYTGSDPVADKYVSLTAQGSDTLVLFDRDGTATGQQWPNYIIKLQGVAGPVTWAQLSGGPPPAQPTVFNIDPSGPFYQAEGNSGGTPYSFVISRSGSTQQPGSVTWGVNLNGHSATASDFSGGVAPGGTVSFAAGETSKTLTLHVAGDSAIESNETFGIYISNAQGGTIGGSRSGFMATILNDDDGTPPSTNPGQNLYAYNPGSTVTGGAGDDTIHGSQSSDLLTGGAGADKFVWANEPWSPGTITDFAVGADRLDLSALLQKAGYAGSDPVADKYISVRADGSNTLVLFDRDGAATAQQWPNYILKLQGVSGPVTWEQLSGGASPPPATTPQIAIRPIEPRHAEGNSGTVQFSYAVERTGPTGGTSTVNWAVEGSGAQPVDAADFGGSLPSGVLTFAPGETYKTVTFRVSGDSAVEPDEALAVRLSGASGATLGNALSSGTIVNDDQPPAGDQPGRAISGGDSPSTLTGTSGADTITAGRSADTITGGEGGDLLVFRHLPWQGSKVTDFKVGADRLDFSQLFQAAGYSGSNPEGDGYISYKYFAGLQIYFDPDASGTGQWPFLITTLQGVPGGTYRWADLSASGSTPPPSAGGTIRFAWTDTAILPEGDSGPRNVGVPVTRSDTTGSAAVEWTVTPSGTNPASAADFAGGALPSGTVTFAPGEQTKFIVFNVAGDTAAEPDEGLTITLSNPQGASLGANATLAGLIQNDDGGQPPPSSGQVINSSKEGDVLTGGAGADTLNAGRGPDQLTGAGGADRFVFVDAPWNAGKVTDFTPGTDKIDLRGIFDDAGYTGTDPIRDGWLKLNAGDGGTQVVVDMDGPNASGDWPVTITTLLGVTPSQLGSADWIVQ
jgi:Ca2+-binding RTX toxin-like protein